jgi:DNA-binding GntR family transcriptional regulator
MLQPTMKLDATSPVPLYQQLQGLLRAEIAGRFRKAGSRLPSEHELCRQFGITRPTVRQALEGLVREGIVQKHRGKGAFVTEPPLPVGLFSLIGTSEAFAAQQISVETLVLHAGKTPLCLLAEGQDPPGGWVVLERVRRINNVPTFYEYAWIHAMLVPGLELLDLRNRSLFQVLAERYRLRVEGGRQRFSAAAAPLNIASALNLKAGAPLLRVVRSMQISTSPGKSGLTLAAKAAGGLQVDLYVAPGPFVLEENIPASPGPMPAGGSMPGMPAVKDSAGTQ